MSKIAKTLIVGTALLTITTLPAYADSYGSYNSQGSGTQVVNGQVNLADVWSQLDTQANAVETDVSAASATVGNTATIITMSNTAVDNFQNQKGTLGSEVNAHVADVGGSVGISSTVLCNGASVSTDPLTTAVNSTQSCGGGDPSATANANIANVNGGVGIATMAVGNQIEIDSNAATFPVNSYQENRSGTYANVNATMKAVNSAAMSATAVGNTATVIQY